MDIFPLWQHHSSSPAELFLLHKTLAPLNMHFFLLEYARGRKVAALESLEATGQVLQKGAGPQLHFLVESTLYSLACCSARGSVLFNHTGLGFMPKGGGLSAIFKERRSRTKSFTSVSFSAS